MEFTIGQKVRITESGLVGTITGFENGKWVVALDGGSPVLKESTEITKTQNLFG